MPQRMAKPTLISTSALAYSSVMTDLWRVSVGGLSHLPDEGLVVGGAGQDVGAVPGEAGADVEGAVDVAGEGRQRLRGRPRGAQQVVAAVAAAHQQPRACACGPLEP